jgi:hypothetical protein
MLQLYGHRAYAILLAGWDPGDKTVFTPLQLIMQDMIARCYSQFNDQPVTNLLQSCWHPGFIGLVRKGNRRAKSQPIAVPARRPTK